MVSSAFRGPSALPGTFGASRIFDPQGSSVHTDTSTFGFSGFDQNSLYRRNHFGATRRRSHRDIRPFHRNLQTIRYLRPTGPPTGDLRDLRHTGVPSVPPEKLSKGELTVWEHSQAEFKRNIFNLSNYMLLFIYAVK